MPKFIEFCFEFQAKLMMGISKKKVGWFIRKCFSCGDLLFGLSRLSFSDNLNICVFIVIFRTVPNSLSSPILFHFFLWIPSHLHQASLSLWLRYRWWARSINFCIYQPFRSIYLDIASSFFLSALALCLFPQPLGLYLVLSCYNG